MSLTAALLEKGIKFSGEETLGQHLVDCPKSYCQASRKGTGNHTPLKLNIVTLRHAKWKCGCCLWTDSIGLPTPIHEPAAEESSQTSTQLAHVDMPYYASDFLSAQGITPDMAAKHRLKWDDEREVIKIPYEKKGEVVNALIIDPRTGETRLGSTRCIPLYGDVKAGSHELVIAHRELDRIILDSLGVPNVVSLPNGGILPSNEGENINMGYFIESAHVFDGITKVVIALDNTPEGDLITREIVRRVGAGRCLTVKFAHGNLAATLKKSGADLLLADVNDAVPFPITGLYQVSDFEKSLLQHFEGGMAAGVTTGWKNVDKLYTVMPGELTVVTGVPNNGKSEWLDALTMNLCQNHDWNIAVFSPENGKEQHVTKLVEKRVEASASPLSKERMNVETFFSGVNWVNNHYFFIVADDEKELPTLDWILDKASAAVLRYGVKGLIIDPWNEIEHQRAGSTTETEYISQALSKLKRFARNHGLAIWVIAHPNKMQTDKEGYPLVPSLYDISGSAHWANKTDNGIVIHRSNSADNTTEVHVRKVRFKHVGKRGDTKLKYIVKTGRYIPLDESSSFSMSKETDGIKVVEAV